MNGFSLSYWDESPGDIDPGWRLAIVVEATVADKSEQVWRRREPDLIDPNAVMRKIEMELGETKLEGFTLFFHPGKGWQMSTRRAGERGWSVEQGLTDEQVRPIFDLLEPYGHPESPWRIVSPRPASSLFGGLTAAILARLAS